MRINTSANIDQFNLLAAEKVVLSSNQIEHALKVFSRYDKDGNGNISKNELKSMMEEYSQPMGDKEIEDFFKIFDTDTSESIEFDEFLEVIKYRLAVEVNKLANKQSLGNSFEPQELEQLVKYLDIVTFKTGETIYRGSESGEAIFMILDGRVKGNFPDEEEVRLFEEEDVFVITIKPEDTAEHIINAGSDGIALRFRRSSLERIISRHPLIALKLNQVLGNRLNTLIKKVM